MVEQVRTYLEEHQDRFVSELVEFLKIPSVSADSTLKSETRQGAEFVLKQMEAAGLESRLVETAGHPIVYGAWKKAAGKPTVLVYGHYDVQPPDPLDQWTTPPFEPDIRDGHIYARGATDDKGQMYTHIKSVEAWMKTHGELPVNVVFVIEGEEEVGSNNLDRFLEENHDLVASDIAVISDTSQYAPGIPAITYGLRGILACEVIVRGPKQDLHSGVFGGAVTNPGNALAKMVAALHDDQGRVQIPGFYDAVLELTQEERDQFAALPFDEAKFMNDLGVNAVAGEAGFTTLERRWARPTCDVNGMISGYTGEGPKTIVPAQARVKLTCRLVPDQDPKALTKALEQFLRDQLPAGLTMEFIDFHGCRGLVFDFHSPYMSAARSAIEQAFGAAPVMIREGGSIPVVETFQKLVGVETLLLGWGQNTDNLHSPNERFSQEAFRQGTLASALLWQELSEIQV
ncbi:MAG: dipeptidase [Planctomycetaceae bacterium]|nr:dipeptidase [Planctomycetaceae bacterium]